MAKWEIPSDAKLVSAKAWWKSKTLWFNVATALVTISNEMAPLAEIMSKENSEAFRSIIIVASVLGNTILRLVTKTPVTFR